MIRKLMGAMALSVLALTAVGCSSDTQQDIKDITSIRYTGDTATDLKNLCKIGRVTASADFDVDSRVAKVGNRVAGDLADKSGDQRVKDAAKAVEWTTSTNLDVRQKGIRYVKRYCG